MRFFRKLFYDLPLQIKIALKTNTFLVYGIKHFGKIIL